MLHEVRPPLFQDRLSTQELQVHPLVNMVKWYEPYQEQRISQGQTTAQDQGQCRINADGELEGWCSSGGGVEYSMISEENDDYTKKTYKIDSNLSFLDGVTEDSLQGQVQHMEQQDNQLGQKRQQFDNDYERLQRERGEIGNGMARK